MAPGLVKRCEIRNLQATIQFHINPFSDEVKYEVVLDKQTYSGYSVKSVMADSDWENKMNNHMNRVNKMIDRFFTKTDEGIHLFVKNQVKDFNRKVANGDTFVLYPFSDQLPMNATSTRYPELSSSEDLINLHLDGRFMSIESN